MTEDSAEHLVAPVASNCLESETDNDDDYDDKHFILRDRYRNRSPSKAAI